MEIKFISFSSLLGCQAVQKFVSVPSKVFVSPQENTTLTCLVENMGGECRWQKDGKVETNLIFVQNYLKTSFLQPVGLYPGKYSLSDTPGDCSLTISMVDPSLDEGDWECQVTSSSFQSQDALASPRARLTVQGTRFGRKLVRIFIITLQYLPPSSLLSHRALA